MIKLINYLPYGVIKEEYISKSSIDNMYRESEFIGDGFTNVCMNGAYHLHVKETPEEILAMPDIEEGNKAIDWEQRRYDLVSALFVKYACSPDNLHYLLNDIIPQADALIDELKKGGEK